MKHMEVNKPKYKSLIFTCIYIYIYIYKLIEEETYQEKIQMKVNRVSLEVL